MSIVKGLKGINARIEANEAKASGGGEDFVKTKWFTLKDKESAKVIFLQELDADSANYSKKNDLGFVAVEHSNPDDFKRKALCTIEDEGACWACEQHRKDYKAGWKQKTRLYINVLVNADQEDAYVAVLSQGLSSSQITPALIEQSGEIGTITDKFMKIKRNGAGFNDTSYVLTPLGAHDKDVESYELFDLEKVVRKISYDQQEAHYLSSGTAAATSETREAPAFAGSTNEDESW